MYRCCSVVWRVGSVVLSSIWVGEHCAGRLPDRTRHQTAWSLVMRRKHVSLWNALSAGTAPVSRKRKSRGTTQRHVLSVASFTTSDNPVHIRQNSENMFPFGHKIARSGNANIGPATRQDRCSLGVLAASSFCRACHHLKH
jgi:hypothetical protein